MSSLEPGQKQSGWTADGIVKSSSRTVLDLRSRPLVNESQATDVAWIVMALQGEAGLDARRRRLGAGKGDGRLRREWKTGRRRF